MTLQIPKTDEPAPMVHPAVAARQRALAAWHTEWTAGQIAKGVDGPVPDGRPEDSDYNLHVPDLAASATDEDAFHAKARKIMGLAPLEAS